MQASFGFLLGAPPGRITPALIQQLRDEFVGSFDHGARVVAWQGGAEANLWGQRLGSPVWGIMCVTVTRALQNVQVKRMNLARLGYGVPDVQGEYYLQEFLMITFERPWVVRADMVPGGRAERRALYLAHTAAKKLLLEGGWSERFGIIPIEGSVIETDEGIVAYHNHYLMPCVFAEDEAQRTTSVTLGTESVLKRGGSGPPGGGGGPPFVVSARKRRNADAECRLLLW